jgi:hypothetical protein
LIHLALYENGRQVFASEDSVDQLDGDDFTAVSAAVMPALGVVSPVYGMSDTDAWRGVLVAGCKHASNMHTAGVLGSCVSETSVSKPAGKGRVLHTLHRRERPDRFFGLPLGQLTDGHWLCFRAARRYVEGYEKGA